MNDIITLKDLYDGLQTTAKNILGGLNSNIMSSMWNDDASMIAQISTYFWYNNFEKELSFIVEKYFEMNEIDIENINATKWSSFLRAMFSQYITKWTKLYENIYDITYNPIWNVDGTESIIRTFEHGKTTTNTITSDVTQKSRNAFNSVTPKDTDRSSTTGSNSSVDSGCDTERVTNTRGGNIGVTSTQNMLEQELSFRLKFDYYKIVCEDIAKVLTYSIY